MKLKGENKMEIKIKDGTKIIVPGCIDPEEVGDTVICSGEKKVGCPLKESCIWAVVGRRPEHIIDKFPGRRNS